MINHDLCLADWGPYNKEYLGVSHITDKKKGARFDINLFPGFYRRSVMVPKDICDNGAKIMKSSADLSHFVYRYELIWKDEVYIDADFKAEDSNNLKIECKIVNDTDAPQSVIINLIASMQFPTRYKNAGNYVTIPIYDFKGSSKWLDAIDYTDIKTNQIVASDGLKRGEKRIGGAVGGSAVSFQDFDDDGYILYKFDSVKTDKIYVRYTSDEDFSVKAEINGKSVDLCFKKNDEFGLHCIKTEDNEISEIKILPQKGNLLIDGFVFGDDYKFECYTNNNKPNVTENGKSITLEYADGTYEISWDYDMYEIRSFTGNDIGDMLTKTIHNHVAKSFSYDGGKHFENVFIRPVFVDAKSSETVTFNVKYKGKKVSETNTDFVEFKPNSDGEKYELSQNIMAATTLTNVVFPIYCKQQYIRHNTPGRLWDSLYTWDSGFIGMGLNTVDKKRATDCLNAYMTEVGDVHSPFIFHGSVVPTQMFLYLEIFNNFSDKEFLEKYYPNMMQYYNFFRNICMSSKIKMGKTWEIFYSSGGWDDYPPQKFVIDNRFKKYYYPVITTSMTIMCAKIMKNISKILGKETQHFDEDIKVFSDAIQKYAWDDETGYFGYVKLSDDGKTSILKYDDKVNYDMGLDGAYPYIAGVSTDYQTKRIKENIKNGLVTKYGVSVVDTRAPYYKKDGYWNGSVWMPHQWILYKALLDNGDVDFADEIAKTALDVWKNEVELTYNCYEHFMIQNGRGAGFHQFSGLSTPVLMWYKTYYVPKTVTVGFYTILDNILWNNDSGFSCEIKETNENSYAIICLDEKNDYEFKIDGESVYSKKITNGAYRVKIKCGKLAATKK